MQLFREKFPSEITELYHRYNGTDRMHQAVVFFVLGGPLLVDLVNRQGDNVAGAVPSAAAAAAANTTTTTRPSSRKIPYFYNAKTVIPAPEVNGEDAHEDLKKHGAGASNANKDKNALDDNKAAATGCVDRSGRFAFVGSVKGELSIVDLDSLTVMDHILCCETKLRIMHIHMSSQNDRILVNGCDRMLRVCSVDVKDIIAGEGATPRTEDGATPSADNGATTDGQRASVGKGPLLTLVQTFKNSIENFAWGNCSFSHDCRYVIGSPLTKTGETHQLHVFNCLTGNFECVLEGPPESVTHIEYHPHSPILLSVSSGGEVYVWAKNYTEKWSAFAPDFRELDENEEYVEREDEFDLSPHDPEEGLRPVTANGAATGAEANGFHLHSDGRQHHADGKGEPDGPMNDAESDAEIDVTTVDKEMEALDAFDLCDDCHEEPLRYLPITPGSMEIVVHQHEFASGKESTRADDGTTEARASKKGVPSSSQPAADANRVNGGAARRERRRGGGDDAATTTVPAGNANDRKRRGDEPAPSADDCDDGPVACEGDQAASAKKKAKKRR